jgi:hypothetical protein
MELDRSGPVYNAVAGICGHSSEPACYLKHRTSSLAACFPMEAYCVLCEV